MIVGIPPVLPHFPDFGVPYDLYIPYSVKLEKTRVVIIKLTDKKVKCKELLICVDLDLESNDHPKCSEAFELNIIKILNKMHYHFPRSKNQLVH